MGGPLLWLLVVSSVTACLTPDEMLPDDSGDLLLTMQASLEPAQEVTWCQYVLPAMGVPEGISIQDIAHETPSGSTHHVIWYQMAETPESVADKMAPFRCDDGIHLRKIGILYAPPAATGELSWPEGVAAFLAQDAVTLIEWHIINTRDEPVEAELRVRMTPPEQPARLRAGTLLLYDWFVHLPPKTTHTSRTRCRIPADVTLLWASQHMHQRGVSFTARVLTAQGEPLRDIIETDSWNADAQWFDIGIPLKRGQWVEFACSYDNPSDYSVIEGDAADDEMCMFVAGYYPKITVPLGETCQLGDGSGPVFSGAASCAESLQCLQRSTDRKEAHRCWNATRAEDSTLLVELAWQCSSAYCYDECERTGFSDTCMQCLAQECAPQLSTCLGQP